MSAEAQDEGTGSGTREHALFGPGALVRIRLRAFVSLERYDQAFDFTTQSTRISLETYVLCAMMPNALDS